MAPKKRQNLQMREGDSQVPETPILNQREQIVQIVAQQIAAMIPTIIAQLNQTRDSGTTNPETQTHGPRENPEWKSGSKRKWMGDTENRVDGSSSKPYRRGTVESYDGLKEKERKPYRGTLPLCHRCGRHHHQGDTCQEVRCYRCRKSGHTIKDCGELNKPKGICFQCGEKGHMRNACPTLLEEQLAAVEQRRGGMFVIRADEAQRERDVALGTVRKMEKPYLGTQPLCYNCGRHHLGDCWRNFACSRCKKIGHKTKDCKESNEPNLGAMEEARKSYQGTFPLCYKCGRHHLGEFCHEIVCHRCGQSGHTTKNCEESSSSEPACYHCGNKGHVRNECPQLKGKQPVAFDWRWWRA